MFPNSFPVPAGAKYKVFTSSGVFTPPQNVTMYFIDIWGGGGSGSSGVGYSGAGGGARNIRFISPLFVTTPIIVTIGAGGSSVTGTVIGNNGGNSSFGSFHTVLKANGCI